MNKGGQKESGIIIAAIVAIVLLGTWLTFTGDSPEQVVATSEDGRVVVEGLTRSVDSLVVRRYDGVIQEDYLLPDVYQVAFEELGRLSGAHISVSFQGVHDVELTDVVLYQYDPLSLRWVALPTFFDLSEREVVGTIAVNNHALFAVGVQQD